MNETAVEIAQAVTEGRLDPRPGIEAGVAAARSVGRELNAFVEVRPEAVEESGSGRLAGVPVAVKDMFVDRGRTPTCGSNVGAHWTDGTATIIERLRDAGAAIVGYTNLHEWGIGTTSSVSASGPIRNPRDRAHIAGGSSGGSAAAVAAGIVPAATGTDAGGSIRVPAACCGVVGLKPTWGAVPLDGFAEGTDGPPVDHAGPLARSVDDVRLLFDVMSAQTLAAPSVDDLRVGVLHEFFFENAEERVADAIRRSLESLRPKVASVTEVVLEGAELAQQALPLLLLTHTASLLKNDLEARPEAFQPASLNLLMLGTQMTEQDVAQADAMRVKVRSAWDRVFEMVDVVITPTIPGLPPPIGQDTLQLPSGEWSTELAFVAFNAPMNLGGVPALSIPCGEADGWSVSMTISAARGRDDLVLALGAAVEEAAAARPPNDR
jgi:aspartyl-tRNA(Asn)/glutamyl-tRNA(Gln) amidotransferase subunit A